MPPVSASVHVCTVRYSSPINRNLKAWAFSQCVHSAVEIVFAHTRSVSSPMQTGIYRWVAFGAKAFPLGEGAERSEAKEGTQVPIYHPGCMISVQYPLSSLLTS